jgi:endonuclease/exonuclease/phosphatase family metal-dependent hydrolase
MSAFCETTGGWLPAVTPLTFPAWNPRRDFDHIVTGGGLSLSHYAAEPMSFSDHLPVAARLEPGSLFMAARF